MVSSILSTAVRGDAAPLSSAQAAPAISTNAFALQLASAIQADLNPAGSTSHIEVDIQPEQGQNSGTSQFLVTVTDANATSPSNSAPSPSTPVPATAPAASPGFGFFEPSAAVEAAAAAAPVAEPIVTPSDAYWAEQPPAVQALRNTPEDQRLPLAQKLAGEGYAIDVPIMVWGWDPLVTMTVRQNMGYTWVPSALQPPVSVVPGVTFPGSPSYDPHNPPPGSIPVSTAFAQNANSPDPWMTS
jgi:hypothetical protein